MGTHLYDDVSGGDQQWPPAEGPAGTPREGEQPDRGDEAPIGDRLGRDLGNLGDEVPDHGDVSYPAPETPTPHM